MSTSSRGATGTKRSEATVRRSPLPPPQVARRRVTIERLHPWSVLKISLIFYFCVLLVVMVGLALFWSVIIQLGVIQAVQDEADKYGAALRINGGNLARLMFLLGIVNVVLWSAINVFLAFLYNLIADLVGGLRVTLSEDETSG